jgi:tetrahydromethanopterin S-methyltransferase subunit B
MMQKHPVELPEHPMSVEIRRLEERIAELETGIEKILTAGAKKEERALLSIKGLMERITELEAFVEKVAALSGYVDTLELYKEAQLVLKGKNGIRLNANACGDEYDPSAYEEEKPSWPEIGRMSDEIRNQKQRITELEAEIAHYKEWLKERTSELEAQVQSTKLIAAGSDKRIAELEAFLRDYLKVGHTILAERAKKLLQQNDASANH